MTLPTLNWRQSALYAVNASTTLGVLTALHTLFATEEANGGRWAVNYWDSVNGVLELKLAGTQTGVAASQRILLFGSQTVHAGALADGLGQQGATAASFWVYYSLDANTGPGGPPVLYTAGNPYPASTKAHKGTAACASQPSVTTAYILDCEEALVLVVNTATGPFTCLLGRLLDDNATGRWCKFVSRNVINAPPTSAYAPWFVTGAYDAASWGVGLYIDETGGGVFSLSRLFRDLTDNSALTSATLGAIFHPVLLAQRQRDTSNEWQGAGWLRQLRYGPSQSARTVIYSGGEPTGYVLGHPGAAAACLIADFVA